MVAVLSLCGLRLNDPQFEAPSLTQEDDSQIGRLRQAVTLIDVDGLQHVSTSHGSCLVAMPAKLDRRLGYETG